MRDRRRTVERARKRRRRGTRACQRRATEVPVRRWRPRARRCHAPCTPAHALTNGSVRSAPMMVRLRRLRAAEGPPLLARPDGRHCMVRRGGVDDERTSRAVDAHRSLPMFDADGLHLGSARPWRSRPPGARGREGPDRAQASETSDHRCAADGYASQYLGRFARCVTTARGNPDVTYHRLRRALSARTVRGICVSASLRSYGAGRAFRPSPSTWQGPSGPAPGAELRSGAEGRPTCDESSERWPSSRPCSR